MKFRRLIFAAVCAAALSASAAAFAAPGDIAGNIYYTDIKTYIYHSPITSYNIGGRTVIDAEILNWHYGFDVYWYADTRRLEITDKGDEFNSLQAMSGELVESAEGTVGEVFGSYYETDIVTTLNGSPIESYNIGGRTFISAEAMRDFGYNVDWNESARTLTITKPMDFYKIETDYGTIKTTDNRKRTTGYVSSERSPILVDENGGEFKLALPPTTILQGPGVADDYIRLSYVQKALNAECTLVEQVETYHTEWVNGISYDTPSYAYYIDFKYDADAKPEIIAHTAAGETTSPAIRAEIYDYSLGLLVNGEANAFLKMAGGKEYEGSLWIVDGEIYVPTHTLGRLLGYEYTY